MAFSGDKTPLVMPAPVARLNHLVTNQLPNDLTVGGSTDCSEVIVGDFTKLVIGIRPSGSVQILRSNLPFMDKMQIAILCWIRADVGILQPTHFHVTRGVRD